jgi:outer membrane protein assembly factor BamB
MRTRKEIERATMRKAKLLPLMTAVWALLLGTGGLRAQDWPQWRGPDRDGRVTGFFQPKSWPKDLALKWKVSVGEGVTTPALVGERLYVFGRQDGQEVTRCLDAATGKELWKDQYAAQGATGAAAGFSGPRSSPTVVVDGLCVAQFGKETNGGIVAYDVTTGEVKWKWTGDGPAYASPVLLSVGGTKLVVAQTESKMVAVTATDGKLVWEAPFATTGRSYNAATPIVSGQTIIYTGGGRGVRAVRLVKEDGGMVAEELWHNRDKSVQFNTPVLKEGFLYGLSQDNELFCLDAETGKTDWSAPIAAARGDAAAGGGRRGGGRGGYGSIVDAGSVLFALTPGSELVGFSPDSKSYNELARIKVADTPTYAYPIVAGNRVFVGDRDALSLLTID